MKPGTKVTYEGRPAVTFTAPAVGATGKEHVGIRFADGEAKLVCTDELGAGMSDDTRTEREQIRRVLGEQRGGGQQAAEIAELSGVSLARTEHLLVKLAEEDLVQRDKRDDSWCGCDYERLLEEIHAD